MAEAREAVARGAGGGTAGVDAEPRRGVEKVVMEEGREEKAGVGADEAPACCAAVTWDAEGCGGHVAVEKGTSAAMEVTGAVRVVMVEAKA